MLDPLLVFLYLFAGMLLVAIIGLLALGQREGTLAAVHWPRALLFACVGSAGAGAVGMLVFWVVAAVTGWGGGG